MFKFKSSSKIASQYLTIINKVANVITPLTNELYF